ncbi:hypothetical protein EDC01DRAFT_665087 [Geopyxis carbonaria]|nr:hypothetical protein EDC01DRAFT_665087 [Geopyxis carbonaria]
MTSSGKPTYYHATPVTVSLSSLQNGDIPSSTLLSAFGPSSLGILVVSDLVPKFSTLRRTLLTHASTLANLPPAALAALECAEAKYLVGWSCGKEQLSPGRVDTLKGSFYANCDFYSPAHTAANAAQAAQYPDLPEYTHANIWPDETAPGLEALKGFRATMQELCSLIIDTAVLVARACDRYAIENVREYEPGYLEHVVSTSSTTKARLLHYFPPPPSAATEEEDLDSWCGTHLDHGCLTGLTSALYARGPEALDASPDPEAGLYIRDRQGGTAKVAIPADCLAFQTGEALERITGGELKAVPHFVRGARASMAGGVGRSTLAVFTQPNLGETVDRERGMTFAGFAKEIVGRNTADGM